MIFLGPDEDKYFYTVEDIFDLQTRRVIPFEPRPTNHEKIGLVVLTRPTAPYLPDDISDKELVAYLVKLYTSCLGLVSKYKNKNIRAPNISNDLSRRIIEVGRALIHKRLTPAQFIWWRTQQWINHGGGSSTLPPVLYVFNVELAGTKSGWCRKETGLFLQRQQYACEAYQELITLYAKMKTRILRTPIGTDVIPIRNEYFPGNRYNDLVALANKQFQEVHEKTIKEIQNHELVWVK